MNTERISLMEQRLDRATAVLSALQTALDQYETVLNDIDTLNTYLGSPEWHNDRDDDVQKNAPRAFVLDLHIEHISGKHVREK